MTTATRKTRKTAKPGQRAVGFRAPTLSAAAPAVPPAQKSVHRPVSTGQSTPQLTSRSTPPVKKRAKGSGFLGVVFLGLFGTIAYLIWTNFLQYQSYGVIEGRMISVSAPWDGTIVNWQVREGELVQQGDILTMISNLDMEHELASLGDELKMTQAQLDAEMSRVRFDLREQNDRSQKATAEYLQMSGELVSEQAKLKELQNQLERSGRLLKSQHVSRAEFEKLFYQHAGQKQKIAKLIDAVEVLRIRSEQTPAEDQQGASRLKPLLAKIEQTQAEMARLRERINQGNVVAPVSGRIAKRFCLTGEGVKSGSPVLQILEDNSIEATLYVPQQLANEFTTGNEVEIVLEPYEHPMRCTVHRIGERFEAAPENIARYYPSNQYLLPVYLTPRAEFSEFMSTRVGGTIKRPYPWKQATHRLIDEWKQKVIKANGR